MLKFADLRILEHGEIALVIEADSILNTATNIRPDGRISRNSYQWFNTNTKLLSRAKTN